MVKYRTFLLKEFQLTLSNMHLHIQDTILAHIVFIKDSSASNYISLLTLIQNFVSRYILKGKRYKIDKDYYRPDVDFDTLIQPGSLLEVPRIP